MTKKKLLYIFSIFGILLAAYLPFLPFRMARMAGDEKVYVAQSLEMTQAHTWFEQRLQGEPNFFKGPFHYAMTRAGFKLFGENLFSTVYMNLLILLLACGAAFLVMSRIWPYSYAALASIAVGLNLGIFSHSLVSQMEVELYGIYLLTFLCLGRLLRQNQIKTSEMFLLWACAGLASWIKSPLHSVLLGAGILFTFAYQGSYRRFLTKPVFWLAAFTGVLLACAGYIPLYLSNPTAFVDTYLHRETLDKVNNQRSFLYVLSSLPHFLFPWTLLIFWGLFRGIQRSLKIKWVQNPSSSITKWIQKRIPSWKRIKLTDEDMAPSILSASLCFILPTFLFFCSFRYKGQNYNLPALGVLLLGCWDELRGVIPRWHDYFLGAIHFLAGSVLLIVLARFWPLPEQLHSGLWILSVVLVMSGAFLCFYEKSNYLRYTIISLFFMSSVGWIAKPLGEFELVDAKNYLKELPQGSHPWVFDNTEHSIWNEWALMSLALHVPTQEIHSPESFQTLLKQWAQETHEAKNGNNDSLTFIAPHEESLNQLKLWATQAGLQESHFKIVPWRRWLTKGKSAEGKPLFLEAWSQRNLAVLQKNTFIFRIER